MKKIPFILATLAISLLSQPPVCSLDTLSMEAVGPSKIIVNNRILARVNNISISTFDVAKKMDMLFYKQFPEYISSIEARHQYYMVNWKAVLEDLIHKELILADAKESKIEASGGDIRQEMELLFGPNIIDNLDKSNMTFEEAYEMVKGEIIIQRMINMKVYAKALRIVTPSKVRQAYEEFVTDPNNAKLNQWRYQVITIKDRDAVKSAELADKAYKLLIEEKIPLDQLASTMKERKLFGRKGKVTLSEEIVNNEKELSNSYRDILETMNAGMISQPSAHKSRANRATVYRIFYVKEKIPGGMPSYNEMENKLKERILNEVSDKETDLYLNKLKNHFHVREKELSDRIPADYQPFILK